MSGANDKFMLDAAAQNLRRLAKFTSQGPQVVASVLNKKPHPLRKTAQRRSTRSRENTQLVSSSFMVVGLEFRPAEISDYFSTESVEISPSQRPLVDPRLSSMFVPGVSYALLRKLST